MRHIFILVPSPIPTGPIKGAYALANALASKRPITLVTLKAGPGADAPLDPRVTRVSLAQEEGSWSARRRAYRDLLQRAGGRSKVASISMCFSADMINRFCREDAVTCASVRGNLLRNYRLDYGWAGVPAAMFHLAALNAFDHVVAITTVMARQVGFYARRAPVVIGNFVDEAALEPYRAGRPASGPLRFVFLASLSTRKQPLVLLRAIEDLRRRGHDVVLDVIGAGPLSALVAQETARLGLEEAVTLHGHLSNPYSLVGAADAMVLPSLSEGIARAALEALYLGVPCVLREADGNAELILSPASGKLFREDDQLAGVMLAAAQGSRDAHAPRACLLPSSFREQQAARRYLELVEQNS